MDNAKKWRRLGHISLLFPLSGVGLFVLFVIFYNDPNDWHGIGRAIFGFGSFAVLSLVGGILGAVSLAKQFTVSGLVSIVIALAALMMFGHILSQ